MSDLPYVVSKQFLSPRLLAGLAQDEDSLVIEIQNIKIKGRAAKTIDAHAAKRGVHPKQILADIIHYVLEDDMVDAILDDQD